MDTPDINVSKILLMARNIYCQYNEIMKRDGRSLPNFKYHQVLIRLPDKLVKSWRNRNMLNNIPYFQCSIKHYVYIGELKGYE